MAYVKKEYQETDPYTSAYSDTITELTGKVSNGEKFDYSPMTDAAYQSYASQYGRLGKEARQNTLADVSNNTGGLASTYATTAAMQAQNVYDQALTDKIPELEALAYDKFNNERNYNLNALGAMQSLDDSAYSKWADNRDYNRNTYEYDNNFNYQNYRDDIGDQQWDKEYDLDLKNYELNKQQQTWSQKFQTQQDKYQRMYNKWTTLGYANKQVAKYFGIKVGTKTSDQKYRDAQIAAMKSSGSSGGSGSSGSYSSGGGSNSSGSMPAGGKSGQKASYEQGSLKKTTKHSTTVYKVTEEYCGSALTKGATRGFLKEYCLKKLNEKKISRSEYLKLQKQFFSNVK
ncbi:hypothetical protein M2140_001925 [Clostridiales Family XIII bacterium PM5-7]